jgi:hypothetical protein
MSIHVQIYLGISAISSHKYEKETGEGTRTRTKMEILSEGIVSYMGMRDSSTDDATQQHVTKKSKTVVGLIQE